MIQQIYSSTLTLSIAMKMRNNDDESYYTLDIKQDQSRISHLADRSSITTQENRYQHKESLFNRDSLAYESEGVLFEKGTDLREPMARIPNNNKSNLTDALKSMMADIGLSQASKDIHNLDIMGNSSTDSINKTSKSQLAGSGSRSPKYK